MSVITKDLDFFRQTGKALSSMVLFILLFVVVVFSFLVVLLLISSLTFYYIISYPGLLVWIIGGLIILFSVSIIMHLFHALVLPQTSSINYPDIITAEGNEKIYRSIEKIVVITNTSFPRKIFIVEGFYLSLFCKPGMMSLLFRSEKYLAIGSQLIESLTQEELEAMLAHEFSHYNIVGHKLSALIYELNKTIHQIVYDDSCIIIGRLYKSGAAVHSIFIIPICAFIRGTRSFLAKLYKPASKHYYSISPEFEFLADRQAALITGPIPLISGLNHIEEYSKKSKICINEQWAAHPQILERIERLKDEFNCAWPSLQETAGSGLSYAKTNCNDAFNGYYDVWDPVSIPDLQLSADVTVVSPEHLFNHEIVSLTFRCSALKSDICTLKEIVAGDVCTETFDYEGNKYRQKEAARLAEKLNEDLNKLQIILKENDKKIYQYFLNCEKSIMGDISNISELYRDFLEAKYDDEFYQDILLQIEKLVTFKYSPATDHVISTIDRIKVVEQELKPAILKLINDKRNKALIPADILRQFNFYLSQEWRFFSGEYYLDESMIVLFSVMENLTTLSKTILTSRKQILLDYQASMLQGAYSK